MLEHQSLKFYLKKKNDFLIHSTIDLLMFLAFKIVFNLRIDNLYDILYTNSKFTIFVITGLWWRYEIKIKNYFPFRWTNFHKNFYRSTQTCLFPILDHWRSNGNGLPLDLREHSKSVQHRDQYRVHNLDRHPKGIYVLACPMYFPVKQMNFANFCFGSKNKQKLHLALIRENCSSHIYLTLQYACKAFLLMRSGCTKVPGSCYVSGSISKNAFNDWILMFERHSYSTYKYWAPESHR